MVNADGAARRVGWVGAGRMGVALAGRLLAAGHQLSVYNRTGAKAEPLAEQGATIVGSPSELSGCDVVFTILAGDDDFKHVVLGEDGVLAAERPPAILVDITTVSPDASAEVRATAEARGTALLAAPVSGNPKVAKAGRLTIVVSGPEDAYREVEPLLEQLAAGVTYVGRGENARLAKICHNLMLGVVSQCLAEIVVLAEKGGMSRAAFLEFLNNSVMGSTFTRYKSPAYVNLDFTPTFTPLLLRKDFDLGLAAARELDVPMPVAAATQQAVQALIGQGYVETDFAALLELQAGNSNLELEPEDVEVPDGLSDAPVAA